MQFRNFKHALLSLTIIGLLGTAAASGAVERPSDRAERSQKKGADKQEVKYPDATRETPRQGATNVTCQAAQSWSRLQTRTISPRPAPSRRPLANPAATLHKR